MIFSPSTTSHHKTFRSRSRAMSTKHEISKNSYVLMRPGPHSLHLTLWKVHPLISRKTVIILLSRTRSNYNRDATKSGIIAFFFQNTRLTHSACLDLDNGLDIINHNFAEKLDKSSLGSLFVVKINSLFVRGDKPESRYENMPIWTEIFLSPKVTTVLSIFAMTFRFWCIFVIILFSAIRPVHDALRKLIKLYYCHRSHVNI